MKNVLFISYFFPPMGGAGVQRSAKFVKYLPESGWRPIVLTVRSEDYDVHREFQIDEALAREMEGGIEVHRTRDWAPKRLRRFLEKLRVFRLFWFLFYPILWEKEFFWALGAIPRAFKLIRERRASVVYTSSAPYSLIVAGCLLRLWTRVPWVADLRDLWTQDPLGVWPSRFHYRLNVFAERMMLRRADVVIANTPLATRRMRDLLGGGYRGRVVTIPNGYDSEDLPLNEFSVSQSSSLPISESPNLPLSESPLVIAHVGTFADYRPESNGAAKRSLLGRIARWTEYRPSAMDPSLRTPAVLLKGLKLLHDQHPELRGKIHLCFVGFLHEGWRRMIRDLGLEDVVDAPGYLPHPDAVARLMQADVLFCVQVGFRDRTKPVPYVPAKLYEYLATGKPVLAAVAPGDTPDVLTRAGSGIFADPSDPVGMSRVLQELLEQCRKGGTRPQPNWEFIRRFDRKTLTRELAAGFPMVTGPK